MTHIIIVLPFRYMPININIHIPSNLATIDANIIKPPPTKIHTHIIIIIIGKFLSIMSIADWPKRPKDFVYINLQTMLCSSVGSCRYSVYC